MDLGEFVYSKLECKSEEEVGPRNRKVVSKKKKLLKSLNQIKKTEETVNILKAKGKDEVAARVAEEKKWQNALDRCEGKKVRDDPKKIERSLVRQQKTKIRHFKKWKERKEKVEDRMERRQQRRQRNIKAKKQEKLKKKMKRLRKKGKII